jgi:FAD binding domain
MSNVGEGWSAKPRTIGWHLIVFATALYLPVLGLTGLLATVYVKHQHEEIRQQSLYLARALDSKLTQTIGTYAAVEHALSASRALQTKDFREFHGQATAAIKGGAWLVVQDRTGQQIVNTRVPWGTQLPITPHPALPKIFEGESYTSDLGHGTVAGQSVIFHSTPVRALNSGEIIYAMTIVFLPEVVLAAIEGESPPEWHTVIMDRAGVIIARVPLHSERVGKVATASTLEDIASVKAGHFEKRLGYIVAAFEASGYRPRNEDVYVMYNEPARMVGRVSLRNDKTLFLFVFTDDVDTPHEFPAQKRLLRTKFGNSQWECRSILNALDEAPELYFDRVSQIRMEHWSCGRVALVGDAAHCVSLLAGQGSALAMTGAYILAGELAKAADQHEIAFAYYERLMRGFVEKKQQGAERFASALAPKTRFGLFFRNQVTKAAAVPGLARLTFGRDIVDTLQLPDYQWPHI